ncbi:uncharacterized protein LOC121137051 [Mesocricetus auratus]|uniref:non-specific serine/threonine protein kinase n=1 Tax=Mesocricetus auratus TaxID=10036 RepID=A0ABM2WVU2_MESAU|nr:uncharacterized protein LOC121137051 [Mesocricetus auratus]XP_040594799.1 uncharacterized protein LOC121137051 [Mesocricetus auratus]XP_040594800.1 uncharacterized protein LOC121137051 [Mesocricetus auratus]XP_040594801.1 uncharacterized protein LOC121137051 [Mesocricetus auratus]XP_040594803.1 uncharacterized protein LOC121137051 [Mesocricetus auratus]XP_040594804.1 uncharacterized protein LOC121137051 [Mesocricetus auratus]XP_040594805.1 uncharacterized protein LOC121137051 [Mesocricetus
MEQGREACCSSEDSFMPEYKMLKTVGQGQFSKVKLAIHVPTVTHVAVKMIRNEKDYASVVASEINIMKSLKHPHIIELFHVFQSRDTTFLVMEHASQGDLYRYIMERRCLHESEARRLFTQIVLAVEYCHNNQIAHRDIKADNILLDWMGNAKLCDFGLAAKVPPGHLLTDYCGTPLYCAPELFVGEAYDGFRADIWSLGVLLFLMVVGRFPFWARSPEGLRRQILSSKYSIPEHISNDIFIVIIRLLMINPGSRPSIDQIMRCSMITDTLARLPPSTQRLPGTLTTTSIVSSMTVMGYKSEENTDCLREQKDNQLMATYLILKHESSVGDSCHQPVKPRQSGLVLNLGDHHTFPVPLRRATEPAPLAFTMSCSLQETEHENNARQGGTRHSMPATLCHLSDRPQPPHLVFPNRPRSLDLTRSSVVMSESSSESKIGSHVSPNDSVCPSLFLMFNDSCSPDDKETTCNTGSVSSWSYQEELCSSRDTAQSVTSKGPSSGDTRQGDSRIQEEISEEMTITQEEAMNEEGTIIHETTIPQEEALTPEVTNTHDETITEETTMVDGETMAHTEAIIEEKNIMEEEDMHREANVSLEVRRTQAGHKTQDDSITEEEAITQGQPEVAGQASSPIRRRHRWKGFRKTMVNCLRHVCFCLPPARRSHDACQNLAPKKPDCGVTHRTWWRPACCSSEDSFMPDYKMLKTVGQGQFSKVKLAIHVPTVTHVAVKMIRNEEYASVVATEINIMKSLKHPNIIELLNVFQSRDTTFLVMEHASQGDLFGHIMQQRCLIESEARRLFTQILLAVQYCHNNQIVHRDIKANNILLDCMGNAKLCDFGLAAKVPPGDLMTDSCGTPLYCAPEVFSGEAYDGFRADIWSLGVLLFLMVVGRFPFCARSPEGVRIPQHISTDISIVITQLLMKDPGGRANIEQIMACPMIRDTIALLPPSTQRLPGTLTTTSIVSSMTVMGYKSEENTDCLREQKDNQLMATYLILKHESSVGDSCHQPVKPRQSGLVLNLGDHHTFPVPLRRATEPAPLAFTMSCSLQETEHENNARQGGTRHSMPATLCHLSDRPQPPHLVFPNRPRSLDLTRSSVVMSESSSESKIGSHVSPNDSVCPSLFLMFNDSCSPDDKETTCNTGSVSSWSYQEELCSSRDTAQSVTSKGPSSGDTRQGDSRIQEEISEEMTITQEEAMNEEGTIIHETTIPQEEALTPEVTNTHDETITEETTMVDGETMAHTEAIIEEKNIMEEEDMHREANVSLEVRRTQAGHKTQDDSITEEEAITQGQPEVAGQASSPIRRRHRWKGFKKTMVNCLRHVCFCLPPARRSHDACQNLAPKKRDPGVTHRISTEDVKAQLRGL